MAATAGQATSQERAEEPHFARRRREGLLPLPQTTRDRRRPFMA